ncbi:MAG: family 10 glycosylhydrolase [Candidatus Neomarinimicrobiota bacterium]
MTKYIIAGLLSAALILPVAAQTGNTEFRSTWVVTWEYISSSNTADQTKARIRQILDNHKAANMNAVLWQVRQSGTAYYSSSYEPWGAYAGGIDPGFDPLAYAVDEAHKRGIELHAWFNVFHASSTVAGTPVAEHPEWVCRDGSGNPMTSSRALSPGLAAVRDYTRDVAMEIVNNYDVDGLHLDYIRWNEYDTGDMRALRETELEQISKLDGMYEPKDFQILRYADPNRFLYDLEHPYSGGVPAGYASWEDYWRASVTTFVQMLHDSIQTVKPYVRLSVAALGKYNWSGWQGYGSVYQDAALWFNEGDIEQLTPMHYHWLDAASFYGMLTAYSPECWGDYIQPGIAAGRLFTAGPASYRLDEENVWERHPSIIEKSRTVPWVDGFQFFRNDFWDLHQYWKVAGETFFSRVTKVRESAHTESVAPEAPGLALTVIDSFNYQLTVTPSTSGTGAWFAVYRSDDATIDSSSDQIIGIYFSTDGFTATETFDGLQDFNGRYTYAATQLNRYWKESEPSTTVLADSLPSLAPTIVSHYPTEGETVDVNRSLTVKFSKNMNTAAVAVALTITPAASHTLTWTDETKSLTIKFPGNLAYATAYSLKIDSSASDVNGVRLDADGDGQPGGSFILNFSTALVDEFPPEIARTNLTFGDTTSGIDVNDVLSIVFDEIIEATTITTDAFRLSHRGNPVTAVINHTQVGVQSVVSIRPESGFESNALYNLTLTGVITDTSDNAFIEETAMFRTDTTKYDEIRLIDNFSLTSNWWQPDGSGTTSGILKPGTLWSTSSLAYVPGTAPYKTGRLDYLWDTAAATNMIREYLSGGTPRAVEFDNTYILQCYVFGDGSMNKLRFALDDNLPVETGSNHEVSPWYTIDWIGWKLISWDLSAGETGTWLGDGVLNGTMRIDSFQLTYDREQGAVSGTLYFDDLRVVKKSIELATEIEPALQPENYVLHQNYPNPFNPSTTIAFTAPLAGDLRLDIYNILGQHVRTLADGYYSPGYHTLIWDGRNDFGQQIASGTYIYRLEAGSTLLHRRLLYLK